MPNSRPLEERLWEKVDIRGPDECWEWLAARDRKGDGAYGALGLSGNKGFVRPHRVILEISLGRPIPQGMCALHRCGNSLCCNPDHIYLGTYSENSEDTKRHGRQAGGARAGERHHKAKLNCEKAREIKRLISQGASGAEIARLFGVSEIQVYRIKNGQSWGHCFD